MRIFGFLIPYTREWRHRRYLRYCNELHYWRKRYEQKLVEVQGKDACYFCRYFEQRENNPYVPQIGIMGECKNTANWKYRRVDTKGQGFTTIDSPILLMPVRKGHWETCDLFTPRKCHG